MDRRRFEGFVVHEGDHIDYVVGCEANEYGMTWFATVFRGAEIRGHPNGILDGVEIEHPDLMDVLNNIVGKSNHAQHFEKTLAALRSCRPEATVRPHDFAHH